MIREDVGSAADLRMKLLDDLGHATPGGRAIYEAAGFEGRTVEEMQLVLPG